MNKKIILSALLLVPTIACAMKNREHVLTASNGQELSKLTKEYQRWVIALKNRCTDPDLCAAEKFEYWQLAMLIQTRELTDHQYDIIMNLLYCDAKH